jgi:hypothetical protein
MCYGLNNKLNREATASPPPLEIKVHKVSHRGQWDYFSLKSTVIVKLLFRKQLLALKKAVFGFVPGIQASFFLRHFKDVSSASTTFSTTVSCIGVYSKTMGESHDSIYFRRCGLLTWQVKESNPTVCRISNKWIKVHWFPIWNNSGHDVASLMACSSTTKKSVLTLRAELSQTRWNGNADGQMYICIFCCLVLCD